SGIGSVTPQNGLKTSRSLGASQTHSTLIISKFVRRIRPTLFPRRKRVEAPLLCNYQGLQSGIGSVTPQNGLKTSRSLGASQTHSNLIISKFVRRIRPKLFQRRKRVEAPLLCNYQGLQSGIGSVTPQNGLKTSRSLGASQTHSTLIISEFVRRIRPKLF